MSTLYRSRYASALVGGFVLLGIALGIAALFVASNAQRWFREETRFAVSLPEGGSFGLRAGADVQLLGTTVGRVEDIIVGEDGSMHAEVAIRSDFARFVTRDSVAHIKKAFGVAGDAYLDVTRGVDRSLPAIGGLIPGVLSEELPGIVERLLDEIRAEAVPALRDLRSAVNEFRAVPGAITDPDGSTQRLLERLHSIATQIDEGEGTLGRLLRDPALADRLGTTVDRANALLGEGEALVKELRAAATEVTGSVRTVRKELEDAPGLVKGTREAIEEMRAILADLRATTAELPGLMQTTGKSAAMVPGLLLQTQKTLRSIERLVEGMQQHWLVRRYVEPEEGGERLSPDEGGGR